MKDTIFHETKISFDDLGPHWFDIEMDRKIDNWYPELKKFEYKGYPAREKIDRRSDGSYSRMVYVLVNNQIEIIVWGYQSDDGFGAGYREDVDKFLDSIDLDAIAHGQCSPCQKKELPVSFSWTNYKGKNWLSPVKDQGMCGSCWVMAPIGVMEAVYNIESDCQCNIDLSEQFFLSSCASDVTGDCLGGNAVDVIKHLKTGGVPEESCFPYTSANCVHYVGKSEIACNFQGHCSKPQYCTACKNQKYRKIGEYTDVSGSRDEVKRNLLCHGPLSVSSQKWEHGFVLVGWDDGRGVWIIKNSWGKGWHSGSQSRGYGEIRYNDKRADFINRAYSMRFVSGV